MQSKKVVWLLNHYVQEPSGSGATRHFSLARHALDNGVQIVLIGASVEHLTGRQRLSDHEDFRVEQHEGVTFLWVRTRSYSGKESGRMLNMLDYTYRVLKAETTRKLPAPDLIIGSSVHPFAAFAGERLARRLRVPFVFEVRDLWPETLIQMGRIKRSSLMARVMRWLESYLCRRARKIITLLPNAGEYIEGLGVARQKTVWISNGVDLDRFPYHVPEHRQTLSFLYLGAHGQANGLDSVIKAIARVQHDDPGCPVKFRFVGDGPLKPALMRLAGELGVAERVRFEPPVPKNAIPALVTEADAFIVNVRNLPLYRYGISMNKLFDYLAAGRPTVFAGSSVNNPVAEAGAGCSVPADDVEGMADAIERIVAMSYPERLAMGERGREYVQQHFSYRQLAKSLCDELLPLM